TRPLNIPRSKQKSHIGNLNYLIWPAITAVCARSQARPIPTGGMQSSSSHMRSKRSWSLGMHGTIQGLRAKGVLTQASERAREPKFQRSKSHQIRKEGQSSKLSRTTSWSIAVAPIQLRSVKMVVPVVRKEK